MSYWLFKTEPDDFSVQHLANSPDQIVRWDGIRNYQARNYLNKNLEVNDTIFIYHGKCKYPGIYGIAKAITAGYPDPSQFDPKSKYFDHSSSTKSIPWICVDIQLLEIIEKPVLLQSIKNNKELNEMILLKQGRLSVQPITNSEAKVILQQASSALASKIK